MDNLTTKSDDQIEATEEHCLSPSFMNKTVEEVLNKSINEEQLSFINTTIEEVPSKSIDEEQRNPIEESLTSPTFDSTSFLQSSEEEATDYLSQIESVQENTEYASQIQDFGEVENQTADGIDESVAMDTSGIGDKIYCNKGESNKENEVFQTTDGLDNSVAMDTSTVCVEVVCNEEESNKENSFNEVSQLKDESSFFQCKVFELGRYLWTTDSDKQCYTKGCIWAPDGTCCLVPVHLDGMHLVELPSDLYESSMPADRPVTKLASAVHVKEGGTVYDVVWYPFMDSTAPETCCWLASRQHEPIQLWDAFNGELRATYRGYDDVDEVEAAISVAFSCDGTQVIGGYKKYIRIFNTDIPGRNSTKLLTKQAISCFALSQSNSDVITTGSWSGVINLYDQRVANVGSLSALFGHSGGITFLKYSNSGETLFSGARKDNGLCVWDMRNFSEPIATLKRSVATNQRIYFDLSPQNEWLISGDTSGAMRVWNLKDLNRKRTFHLHEDSCNGVSFHPTKPIIASSAGQYHFVDPIYDNAEEDIVIDYENSLIFWWIAPRGCENKNA